MTVQIEVIFDRCIPVAEEARRKASLATQKAIKDIEAHAKASMKGPKSGRVYKIRSFRAAKEGGAPRVVARTHQASAPGQAPAVDQGFLIGSIISHMESELVGVVEAGGPGSPQALALEYGTADGRIAPRPYMRPAVEAVKPSYLEAMSKIVDAHK